MDHWFLPVWTVFFFWGEGEGVVGGEKEEYSRGLMELACGSIYEIDGINS